MTILVNKKPTRRASVAELKAQLSRFLAVVKAGEEVIVTERGKPVARLRSIEDADGENAHQVSLVRAGLARPPLRALPNDFIHRPRPADPAGRALTLLLEERAEGR